MTPCFVILWFVPPHITKTQFSRSDFAPRVGAYLIDVMAGQGIFLTGWDAGPHLVQNGPSARVIWTRRFPNTAPACRCVS